jgi:transposase InsO family protein
MAIHQSGGLNYNLQDCSVKGTDFAEFLETLPFSSGTSLLLDNASIHRTHAVREVARERGFRLLFLPPYSPEFNPIELTFGLVKNSFYRRRFTDCFGQEVEPVVRRCISDSLTPEVIRNCFQHVSRHVQARATSSASRNQEKSSENSVK